MGPIHSKFAAVVPHSYEKAKELLFDLSTCPKWNPGIERIDMHPNSENKSETRPVVGVQRRCHFYNGGHVLQEVEMAEGDTFRLNVTELPAPMAFVTNTTSLEKIDDQSCKYTVEMTFNVKLAWLGLPYLMGLTMIKSNMLAGAKREVIGLMVHLDTGEIVTDKTELPKVQNVAK